MQRRKNIRLKNYDYSQNGLYFVTICTKDRECILATIEVDANIDTNLPPNIILSEQGEVVKKYIEKIPGLNKYAIMPNHVHFIVIIENELVETPTGSMWASTPIQAT